MDRLPTVHQRGARRWLSHGGHEAVNSHPHHRVRRREWSEDVPGSSSLGLITLDGSQGEGGGQVLRSALSLSLLTGRPFLMTRIRANRDRPGLRPQHLAAVNAAAELGHARVEGARIGARTLSFEPGTVEPRDLSFDIGTAGATALVLQTLHLPLALKAESPVRLSLTGGTFNTHAPSFPFLQASWTRTMASLGLPVAVAMPTAGFYPQGGGRLEAWIEPGTPQAWTALDRGPRVSLTVTVGTAKLPDRRIAERMAERARELLAEHEIEPEFNLTPWSSRGPGAAISLCAAYQGFHAAFIGLGEPGKPAEQVADEAVEAFLTHERSLGVVDPHTADQLLLPLAFAEGRSVYTVSAVTEHLRTNARTVRAFLDRPIRIEEPRADQPGRVIVG